MVKTSKELDVPITHPFQIQSLHNPGYRHIMQRYTSVYCLNIQVLTMELYQSKKYAVGEECFRDVTVSYPVYG